MAIPFFCLIIFLLDVIMHLKLECCLFCCNNHANPCMMHLELKCCLFCCKHYANSCYCPGSFFFIPYSVFILYYDAFRVEMLFSVL